MLAPLITKNDKLARLLIIVVSFVVFAAIVILSRVKLDVDLGFDVHVFATINAIINSLVSITLVVAYIAVRKKQYIMHRNLMYAAIVLSVLFLVSYILHHLLAGDTRFGGEGAIRYVYFFILITHIILAAVIVPLVLLTVYFAITGQFRKHNRIARWTFPVWLYVAISGVLVYFMISPYYM